MKSINEIAKIFDGNGIEGLFLFVTTVFILFGWKPGLEYLKISITTKERKFIDALEAQKVHFEATLAGKAEQIEMLKLQVAEIKVELEDYRNRYFAILEERKK